MDEKNPHKCPLKSSISDYNNNNNNQMKAILTTDGKIKIILPTSMSMSDEKFSKEKFLLKDTFSTTSSTSTTTTTTTTAIKESSQNQETVKLLQYFENDEDEDDDKYAEYRMTPKQIFSSSICQVCKVNLSRYLVCQECKMVAYCKEEHMKIDYLNHKGLCMAIKLIAKRRGGHVYNMSKHLTCAEFRHLRLHTIYLCEQFLNRILATYEQEIFFFPRLCHEVTCREWKTNLLNDCEKCGLVSYCSMHPLSEKHKKFCSSFALFQRIILHEKSYGMINISLPKKVLKRIPILTDDVTDTIRLLYKNITAFQDECVFSSLMQIATAPLTTFYAYQKIGMEPEEHMTVHFVGAEMQFECHKLEKWESLYLHLLPEVSNLEIVFIGSELNHENLPVDIISRTRMCKTCRINCRGIRFDFQCKKFYHDYCESKFYSKPSFVVFFNPVFHQFGYLNTFDTWPKTLASALRASCPILVTASSENECYLDLQRIKKLTNDEFEILLPPIKNSYSSRRPERNFSSDEDDDAPLTFKNNFMFVIRKTPDLIEF